MRCFSFASALAVAHSVNQILSSAGAMRLTLHFLDCGDGKFGGG